MRILTWNINGVRTLPQYHPWNTLKSFDDILISLDADIICFQEMKTSRAALPQPVAMPPSFDSFFSFPSKKTGYSGVATYTRKMSVLPMKAEEGLSGLVQPKPPLTAHERVSCSGNYPSDEEETSIVQEFDLENLDGEGRAIVVDFGLFVLINVYCPNDGVGTEERNQFKLQFHQLLQARVEGLRKEGREVIVVGDINICASVIDHCEGPIIVARAQAQGTEGDEGFWESAHRQWLRDWLAKEDGTGGYMVDIVRRFWPERKGMYTCWNTKISARETNYGTRIDYILITPGLVPWVKAADIQPQIKGSDHCPAFIDLREEIVDHDGRVLTLRNALNFVEGVQGEPPRLAAKFWIEFSGKQTRLDGFFGKNRQTCSSPGPLLSVSLPPDNAPASQSPTPTPPALIIAEKTSPSASKPTKSLELSMPLSDAIVKMPPKRKITADNSLSSKRLKQKKESSSNTKEGQQKLSSFFAKPKAGLAASSSMPSLSTGSSFQIKSQCFSDEIDPSSLPCADIDADLEIALLLSQTSSSSQSSSKDTLGSKQAWSHLLAPIQAPLCTVHGEPTKEFTVNKPGPNKGKKFFICSRPVGPGYDKGRSERLREEVNPEWRCDYFKWSSEVRKEASRQVTHVDGLKKR